MLSRHASSLYWLGRYQERTEFIARYLEVTYFSTVDSSMLDLRNFTMRSIMFMSKGTPSLQVEFDESEVIWEVALNPAAETSITNYVTYVRENAKSVRNLISNELWENINKNYHFVNSFDAHYLKTRGLHEFTNKIQENAAVFESKLSNTLLHNEPWRYIMLGIYIERAYQILRILNNTILDINALKQGKDTSALENFYWTITLTVLEAADMTRKIFTTRTQQANACEFLITNVNFPRSIAYCLDKIQGIIKDLKFVPNNTYLGRETVEYKCSKLSSHIKYLDYKDAEADLQSFLSFVLKEVAEINDMIYSEFFEPKR